MFDSLVNNLTGLVAGVAGEVTDHLDLDPQTLLGIGLGVATDNPLLIGRGIIDIVDGKEEDDDVQTSDPAAGLSNPLAGLLGGELSSEGFDPLDFVGTIFG